MRNTLPIALLATTFLIGCATAQAAMQATPAAASATMTPPESFTQSPAGTYEIEPTHTNVTWKLNYQGLVTYVARFDKVGGTIELDPANPTAARADITIEAASVNTGLPNFDAKIAKDVFKNEANPSIRFVSSSLTQTGASTGTMTGEMTLAGVSKPVTFAVTFNGARNNMFAGGRRNIGFSAKTTISRAEFGSTQWAPGVGDAVTIEVEASFLKKA
jgi:polyisoprenoid-binding protein YceI